MLVAEGRSRYRAQRDVAEFIRLIKPRPWLSEDALDEWASAGDSENRRLTLAAWRAFNAQS